METVPPTPCTNSSECQNSSCSLVGSNETENYPTQNRELVSALVDLENIDNNSEANAEVTETGGIEKEVNFSELYLNLLETEQINSSKIETALPTLCTNSSECQNSSCSFFESNKTGLFSTQDRELVSVLVDLENIDNNSEANAIGKTRLTGFFAQMQYLI